ncbi:MAG: SGNH/GDSL hydrolase family protein [Novosphingobium sp.]|nr:SGNH/GDSL hydrolase family protein [Novosphingobium sp.]
MKTTVARAMRVLGVGAALLSVASAGHAQDKAGPWTGARYVAMGSSFAAGSGFGPVKTNTPLRCGRSFDNYATRTAETLRMLLVDVTCGGATTANLLGPWNELPPQLDSITPDTALVTVTVGGNDIGYVGYLLAESCKERGPIPLGGPEAVCPQVQAPGDEAYFKLEQDLRAIASEVRRRAPQARLVFVQYLPLVPTFKCEEVPLSPEAAEIGRNIGIRLAQVTERVATETGSDVIGPLQVARKRLPCGGESAWVAGWPADYKQGDTFPWHPTRAGHEELASELVKLLESG